jgi:hypothetical protein
MSPSMLFTVGSRGGRTSRVVQHLGRRLADRCVVGGMGSSTAILTVVGWYPKVGQRSRRAVPEGRPMRLSGQNPKVEHKKTSPNFALLLSREPLINRSCPLVVSRRKPS